MRGLSSKDDVDCKGERGCGVPTEVFLCVVSPPLTASTPVITLSAPMLTNDSMEPFAPRDEMRSGNHQAII